MRVSENPNSTIPRGSSVSANSASCKLITTLAECPKKSLVLIDELEMALTSKGQVKLHTYLTEVASKRT